MQIDSNTDHQIHMYDQCECMFYVCFFLVNYVDNIDPNKIIIIIIIGELKIINFDDHHYHPHCNHHSRKKTYIVMDSSCVYSIRFIIEATKKKSERKKLTRFDLTKDRMVIFSHSMT